MSSCASFIFLFVFSFLTSFRVFAQDPTYRYHTCSDPTTSSGSSVFFSNLETLLSTLSSIDASFTGFQKATVGEPPDRVTELYDCRGDLSPQRCRNCLVFAAKEALIRCPYQRDVTFFYDEFLLTLNKAATEAVNSPKKFGATKTNFTALENLYGQVQCTPDLTRQDCSRCLQEIIDLIPTEKLGARVITPSCSSRYELFQFYNEAAGRTPPPPRPGEYSVRINITRQGGHYSVRINNTRKGSSVRIIIAVVPITAILLLFIAVLIVWARRKKTIGVKKGETEPLAEDWDDITTAGSLQFDFKAIEAATSNFSPSNKLGHGGFGAVYMGTFPSGVQVAVKRLSKKLDKVKESSKTKLLLWQSFSIKYGAMGHH